MFQKSFSVAKRVRTETDIGASAVSVAFAACTLARQIFESLSTVTVMLVGAGETIELVARHLREHKVKKMIIANRTRERAQVLADEVGAEVVALSDIDERLKRRTLSSAQPPARCRLSEKGWWSVRSSPAVISRCCWWISPSRAMLSRKWASCLTPISTAWMTCKASFRTTLPSVKRRRFRRKPSSSRKPVSLWRLRAQSASETIREYRGQAEQVRDDLTAKALAALEQGGDANAIMQDLAWKLTNRLIHAPTKSLQQAARDGDDERLTILRNSLGLE